MIPISSLGPYEPPSGRLMERNLVPPRPPVKEIVAVQQNGASSLAFLDVFLELLELAPQRRHVVARRRRRGHARGERAVCCLCERIERQRSKTLASLQVHLERPGEVAAEELAQGVVAHADQLLQQRYRQQAGRVAILEDDLGQRLRRQVVA